jgi:hypothetical protein
VIVLLFCEVNKINRIGLDWKKKLLKMKNLFCYVNYEIEQTKKNEQKTEMVFIYILRIYEEMNASTEIYELDPNGCG